VAKDIRGGEEKAAGHSEEESGENNDVAQLSAGIARINFGVCIKRKKDEKNGSEKMGVNVH
jgi:hypothetical protein